MLRWAFLAFRISLWVAIAASLPGCGALRLPAIDPTGERVFLPNPSYTTFISPYDSTARFNCLPEPAFTEPPPIPACPGVPGAAPAIPGIVQQPPQPRLLLTPSKIVAPINSEVVLLAGVCGPEGYYITKQPIEWMLSPDSVGNIIALAESSHPHIAKLAHHSPKKECNTLATTRTATHAHTITRGTVQPNDDIWVGKGQTWISVSSPTEGVSHVTALAHKEDNWDFRRQTATIHWVDMQWAFPTPQIVRAGQPSLLSTAVARTSTGNAAVGVLVRYDIVDGTPASFFGEGRTSLELQTNENGRADVQVVQNQPGPGSTRVRIQVLSADLRSGGSDRAVIGEGYTTITWSAPGLTIGAAGPATVARGGVATYRIEVANPGDIATRNVVVSVEFPSSLKYLNSQPAGEVFGNRLQWQIGQLEPKQVVRVDVNVQAERSGETRMVAQAASADAPAAVSQADIRIVESGLAIRFVDPPQAGVVGQTAGFNFEVVNTGGAPLQNVLVRDTFDSGLRPPYPGINPNQPLEFSPGFPLMPGESKQLGVSFELLRAGQLCHTIEAIADGGQTASARACIEVTQPVLSVDVRKVGPDQARVGENVPFTITVTNNGEGVLTNVRIADSPDDNLEPIQGTEGLQIVNNSVVWTLGTLGPNQTLKLDLICVCRRESPVAVNTVSVTADGGVRQTVTANVAIGPALAPRPPVTPPAGNQPPPRTSPPTTPTPQTPPSSVTGEFKVNVVQAGSGIPVGGTGTFYVFLRNERNIDDSDLVVSLQLPDGLEYAKHTWSAHLPLLTNNPRAVEVGPINYIKAMQTDFRPIEFTIRGVRPGRYQIQVQVRSKNLPEPVTTTIEAFVSA